MTRGRSRTTRVEITSHPHEQSTAPTLVSRAIGSRLTAGHLAAIFVVALALRLAHLWLLQSSPFFSTLLGDARAYDDWAQTIANGDWLGREVFYQAPLYPYFLGLLYSVLGRDFFWVRVVQAVIGACACVVLAAATARMFSARAGRIAGLMLAFYAPAIYLGALLQKSILDIVLVCGVLWFVARILDGAESTGVWLRLGLTLGALALSRENAIVLSVVTLAWAVGRDWHAASRRGLRLASATAVLIGLVLTLLPVAARNRYVGGEWHLTTAQLGPNFYIGNNPHATGTYNGLREGREDPAFERADATGLAEAASRRALSPSEVSDFWLDHGLAFVRAQPAAWLSLMGRKLLLLASATEMIDTEAQESHAEWSRVLAVTGVVGHVGVLLPLALLGISVTWPLRPSRILVALAAAYALSVLVFFVVARYRYPLIPFLVLLASAGLGGVGSFLATAARPRQIATAAACALAVVAAFWPVASTDAMRAITETNLGATLQGADRLDDAIPHYQRAIAIDPSYAPAYNNLGVALRALERRTEAITAYLQAIERRPDYLEAHYNLATALVEDGRLIEAIPHFTRAREGLTPTIAGHNNFGMALAAAGRLDEAAVELRAAVSMDPRSIGSLRNLGEVLAKQRRYPEALDYFRRIVDLDEAAPGAHYDFGNILMEAGRLADAEGEFRRVVALAPDSAQGHNNLGVALAAQGRYVDAVRAFEHALELKPDFVQAQRYLAMARRAQRP
jgi:tetratricopeptide (TPR) repeat protein